MGKKKRKISGIRQRTHKGIDHMIDKAERVGERGKKELTHIKDKGVMVQEHVDGYIQKNPERSVLVAAAIGVVIGAFFTAAMMRRKD